ncbi:MAG TPA: hypothetical protein DF613_05545 [Lachnospiraceae bacterium]|nr:hypothetical protein [Lachnospiraceae bacterium]
MEHLYSQRQEALLNLFVPHGSTNIFSESGGNLMNISSVSPGYPSGSSKPQQSADPDSQIQSLEQKLQTLQEERQKAVQNKDEDKRKKLEKQIREIKEQIQRLKQQEKKKEQETEPKISEPPRAADRPSDAGNAIDTYA